MIFYENVFSLYMRNIHSYNHRVYTEITKKSAIDAYDNKRFILENGIDSLPYRMLVKDTTNCDSAKEWGTILNSVGSVKVMLQFKINFPQPFILLDIYRTFNCSFYHTFKHSRVYTMIHVSIWYCNYIFFESWEMCLCTCLFHFNSEIIVKKWTAASKTKTKRRLFHFQNNELNLSYEWLNGKNWYVFFCFVLNTRKNSFGSNYEIFMVYFYFEKYRVSLIVMP